MSKYTALRNHLKSLGGPEWVATFEDIETVLGERLPDSARKYPAWWSNQASPGHSQSGAWKAAGWRTSNVDVAGESVKFVRNRPPSRAPLVVDAMTGANQPGKVPSDPRAGLTIPEAKRLLAAHYGIAPENIEITIRG